MSSIESLESRIESLQKSISEISARAVNELNNNSTDIFTRERRRADGRALQKQAASKTVQLNQLQSQLKELREVESDNTLQQNDLGVQQIIIPEVNEPAPAVTQPENNTVRNLLLLGGALLLL